jgi:hypothetical protein
MIPLATQGFWDSIDWHTWVVRIAMAVAILIVTWILAKVATWLLAKVTSKIPALQHAGSDGQSLGATLGTIASLLVWLFGLVAVLQVFQLGTVLAPIQQLLNGVMDFLPNIIGAIFVFVIGALLARISRQLLETTLGAMPFQRWFGRIGGEEATGNANIVRTLALVVYALIMIVVSIAALQILGISSISDPAQQMLQTIFNAIPNIVAAAVMLALGGVIAAFGARIIGDLLDGLGTDRALRGAGVISEETSATPMLRRGIQVAIMLFFAVMAAQLLNFPVITDFLAQVLTLGARVLFGGAIIAAGFYLGGLLARLFSGTAASLVRWATLVLFAAMGLSFMGIANQIIVLAFGSLVVGAAVAAALAFGLGGRDAAGRLLRRVESGETGGGSGTGGAGSA